MIRGGPGVRYNDLGQGASLSISRDETDFAPAFSVQQNGRIYSVGFGMVNGILVTNGQKRYGVPQEFDEEGRAWVVVTGKLLEIDDTTGGPATSLTPVNNRLTNKFQYDPNSYEIKNVSRLVYSERISDTESVGMHPLAMVRANGDWFQIAYFHLRHSGSRPRRDKSGPVQHFWWVQ
jgi:hypothetical protein